MSRSMLGRDVFLALLVVTLCACSASSRAVKASAPAPSTPRASAATPTATSDQPVVAPIVPVVEMTPAISPDLRRVPKINLDANAQTRSVKEAIETGKYPERLSPLIAPAPFDAEKYRKNPQAYLDIVEPGRSQQSAAPGPMVPHLRLLAGATGEIPAGGSVELVFAAPPGAPISLFSADLGTFANSLVAITVQAGADGMGRARWYASGGVVGTCHVHAACPYAQGRLQIILTVAQLTTAQVNVSTLTMPITP